MRKCRTCGKEADIKKENLCKKCACDYQKKYRRKNRELLIHKEKLRTKKRRANPEFVKKERKRGREYWAKVRHDCIMAYGGYKCACCEETEPLFLTIDHVKNDCAEHRRSLTGNPGNGKGASGSTLNWLKRNGYPQGFQVLCMNCNMGKERNKGICPHRN